MKPPERPRWREQPLPPADRARAGEIRRAVEEACLARWGEDGMGWFRDFFLRPGGD